MIETVRKRVFRGLHSGLSTRADPEEGTPIEGSRYTRAHPPVVTEHTASSKDAAGGPS